MIRAVNTTLEGEKKGGGRNGLNSYFRSNIKLLVDFTMLMTTYAPGVTNELRKTPSTLAFGGGQILFSLQSQVH